MQAKRHPELLTRNQAAEFLTNHGFQIKRRTLNTKVSRDGGPPFRKWGRRVLYETDALLQIDDLFEREAEIVLWNSIAIKPHIVVEKDFHSFVEAIADRISGWIIVTGVGTPPTDVCLKFG